MVGKRVNSFSERCRNDFWLPSVGNQTGDEVDEKVGGAAVAGVFNLGDILELVNDGLELLRLQYCPSTPTY